MVFRQVFVSIQQMKSLLCIISKVKLLAYRSTPASIFLILIFLLLILLNSMVYLNIFLHHNLLHFFISSLLLIRLVSHEEKIINFWSLRRPIFNWFYCYSILKSYISLLYLENKIDLSFFSFHLSPNWVKCIYMRPFKVIWNLRSYF